MGLLHTQHHIYSQASVALDDDDLHCWEMLWFPSSVYSACACTLSYWSCCWSGRPPAWWPSSEVPLLSVHKEAWWVWLHDGAFNVSMFCTSDLASSSTECSPVLFGGHICLSLLLFADWCICSNLQKWHSMCGSMILRVQLYTTQHASMMVKNILMGECMLTFIITAGWQLHMSDNCGSWGLAILHGHFSNVCCRDSVAILDVLNFKATVQPAQDIVYHLWNTGFDGCKAHKHLRTWALAMHSRSTFCQALTMSFFLALERFLAVDNWSDNCASEHRSNSYVSTQYLPTERLCSYWVAQYQAFNCAGLIRTIFIWKPNPCQGSN